MAVLRNSWARDLGNGEPPGFRFAGFDLLDVCGDISALTNCGGLDDVFARAELSDLGLVRHLERAHQIQRGLRAAYPDESHADCRVWAIWRLGTGQGGGGTLAQ